MDSTVSLAQIEVSKCAQEHAILENLTHFLNTYYKLFVIIFGIVGNSICIFIFWRSKLAHSNRTSFYLICLAISDIAFLLVLIVQYLDETKVFLSISKIGLVCKVVIYLGYVINFVSLSLVLAFTVQRLCSICFPLKYFNRKIESNSKLIVAVFIFLGCLLYSYPFYIYHVSDISSTNSTVEMCCLPREGSEDSAEIFNFVDSLITLVFPFCAIVAMNLIMIKTLKNSSYNFIIRTSSTKSTNEILPNHKKVPNEFSYCDKPMTLNEMILNHKNRNRKISKQNTEDRFEPTENEINENSNDDNNITNNNNNLLMKESIVFYKSSNGLNNTDERVQIKLAKKKNKNKFSRLKSQPTFSSNQSINQNLNEIQSLNSVQADASLQSHENNKDPISKRKKILQKQNSEGDDVSRKISPFQTNYKNKRKSSSLLIQIPGKKFSKFSSLFKQSDPIISYDPRTRMSFRISNSRTNSVSARISKMLIIVSSTFLLLNLPIHSFNVYIFITRQIFKFGDYSCMENYIRNIFDNLFFSSFSCNFLLYSISGVSFRNEFKRIVLKLFRIKSNNT
jgi:hypothetical protein